ncbi:hypothetical protein QE374_001295 [Microbacterium sp. SORGH_AS428]|uniref:DUF6328 family protein n=1 Tax=Microbacterium sp. SORGH_AS_0428 TaxID=3041788 RepID=UPI002855F2C5|nr:DUF6328 family protein [Microbacterium sp. SORGH_AS_0428]MDR6199386.1 hypothetical protein [Microbacterium sp. SORGH_AS_0428]
MSEDERDAVPGDGRDESANERADRNWDELVQELRVMQTGTQILTGFLLAVAFQPRFTELDALQVALYIALVVLAGLSTLLALAPVTLHRTVFARRMKPALVRVAARIVAIDLAVIALLSVGVTALIVDVAIGRTAGAVALIVGAVLVVGLWIVLPRRFRRGTHSS